MADESTPLDELVALRAEGEQLRKKIDLLLRLQKFSYDLAGEHNLDRLLQQFVDASIELLNGQASSLLFVDEETNEMIFVLTRGEKEDILRNRRLRPGEGLVGWCVQHNQPAVVNDVSVDDRFSPTIDNITKITTRSLAVAPLVVRDHTIGAIEVVNKLVTFPDGEQRLDPKGFTSEDTDLLLALANQAAIAIERARLLEYLADEQRRLVASQEEVRRKIARDLHDGPAQRLTAMSMNIKFIQQLFERMPDRVPGELAELDNLALRTSREIRTLLFELRPIVLQTRGVPAALEQYVEYLNRDGMNVTLLIDPALQTIPTDTLMPDGVPIKAYERMNPEIEATVFTILQEAVNNCKKHARASRITIELVKDGDYLIASIQDDGVGFNLEEIERSYDQRNSFGLLTMRERAELVHGECLIRSEPGSGTSVTLRVPMRLPESTSSVLLSHPPYTGNVV